jgi:hypothetical protein
MPHTLSVDEIQRLGFEWPKHALIEEYCVVEGGEVALDKTVEKLWASQSFYQTQINQAFAFKSQTGADYSDFTDKFDDYARMKHALGEAIAYLEQIMETAEDRAS